MTIRERAIVRHYLLATDYCAKDTAGAFSVTPQYVNRVVREAMDDLGCLTRLQLARAIERRPVAALAVSLWD